MNYNELTYYEIRQFTRILCENYVNIKYSLKLLNQWINTLKLNKNDIKILKKYEKFKRFLEKELKTILKIVPESELSEYIWYFPKMQRYKRPKKINVKISKRNKNI